MRKIWRISLGVSLVLLGIIGGFIPVLPGFVFGIPGLIILAEYFPWAQRLLDWFKARYADAREAAKAAAEKSVKADKKKRSQTSDPPV
jgi:uncharacterized membrane protein YbaN (DUF454 family)